MTLHRTKLCLAAGVLAMLMAAPAVAQDLAGFQWFAPAEVSPYGGGPDPHTGYFFSYEGLYWNIPEPELTLIGSANTRYAYTEVLQEVPLPPGGGLGIFYVESSTQTTAPFHDDFEAGQRIEFGRMSDENGWLVDIWNLRTQNLGFRTQNVDMVFDDPTEDQVTFNPYNQYLWRTLVPFNTAAPPGRLVGQIGTYREGTPPALIRFDAYLPTIFDSIRVQNSVYTWSVEANFVHRTARLHNGGYFEWYLGARYMEFNDQFDVQTFGTPGEIGGSLGGSYWSSDALNHMVGPQIGLRYFHQHVRWLLNAEARFTPALNAQALRVHGELGPDISVGELLQPWGFPGSGFDNKQYFREFSPIAEFRMSAGYVLTRNVTFTVGWTGVYVGGIARANTSVLYELPTMGINPNHRLNGIFMNGLTMGIQINR